jgi:hypothetical protein
MKIGFSSVRTRTSREARPSASGGVGLAVGHFEANHRRPVLLLECLHLTARLDHDHREWPAIERRAAFEDCGDDPVGLIEGKGSHVVLHACGGAAVMVDVATRGR